MWKWNSRIKEAEEDSELEQALQLSLMEYLLQLKREKSASEVPQTTSEKRPEIVEVAIPSPVSLPNCAVERKEKFLIQERERNIKSTSAQDLATSFFSSHSSSLPHNFSPSQLLGTSILQSNNRTVAFSQDDEIFDWDEDMLLFFYDESGHNSETPFSFLPNELVVKIFSYLTVEELCALPQVCKYWKRLSEDDSIWKSKYRNTWTSLPPFACKPWKKLYSLKQKEESSGWRKGGYLVDPLKGHQDQVNMVRITKQGIVSCSKDETIKLWNTNSYACDATMNAHQGGVACFQCTGSRMITGGEDGSVKFWNLANFHRNREIPKAHNAPITALQFDDHKLVTGSEDGFLKIWALNSDSYKPLHSETSSGIWSLEFEKDLMVTTNDTKIRLWDLSNDNLRPVLDLSGHTHPLHSVRVHGHSIVSAGKDKVVRLWDANTGQCIRSLKGHNGTIYEVQLDDNKILSCSHDKTIKVWDIISGRCFRTLKGHNGAVLSINFRGNRLVSCSVDKTLRIWDFLKV